MTGGTKVSQSTQAAQNTNVNVDIANNIDTGPIADALSQFGVNINGLIQQLNANAAQAQADENTNRQQEVLAILAGSAIQADAENTKTATIKKVTNIALAGTAVYVAYELYKGAK